MSIPGSLATGTYFLGACADDLSAVAESDETNNCRASATTIQVTKPDLIISALSDPPATANAGTSFNVTDTTANTGTVSAGASTTRYRFSLDANITNTDPLLSGTRSVPALAAGADSVGTVVVTIPNSLAPGTYFLGACADDFKVVSESNETNNCRASATTIQVTKPDLMVTSLSNPPATGSPGSSFSVTDTTKNNGSGPAGASITRYRLSLDSNITNTDPLLTGDRSVPDLLAGESSTGTVTVTIPGALAPGTYFLGACADDLRAVTESNETNNCRRSATTITVSP